MAICGRCDRQTESAGEDCPYCGEYATAASAVGALSGSASRASNGVAGRYGAWRPDHYVAGGDNGRLLFSRVKSEFAALPPCERPFAAERTVWPAALELAETSVDLSAADIARAIGEPQSAADDDRAIGEPPEPQDAPDGSADQYQLPDLISHGRWIALTAAILVVLLAAAGAVSLVLEHGRVSRSAPTGRPGVAARPSASAPASVAPAGQNQLIVDPAAATAPDEAAIVAFLNRYFDAINNHSYLIYKRTFILPLRSGISSASFSAEFGTTTDSGEHLRSISVIGGGKVDALVTFLSHQLTAGNPGGATCTAWSIELYLSKRGGRYLQVAQPVWYQAADMRCS
jgi:hypothetical protein